MLCRFLLVCVCVCSLTVLGGCKGSGNDSGHESSGKQTSGVGDPPGGSGGGDSSDDGSSPGSAQGSGDPSTDNKPPDRNSGQRTHITDVDIRNDGGRADDVAEATFGQVFAADDVPRGHHVVAVVDGSAVPTQVDRKATWSSGALRHAVITLQLRALKAGDSHTVGLYAVQNAPDPGSDTLTLDDLLGTDFSASVRIEHDGTTYTADARNALEAIAQRGGCPAWGQKSCKRWLFGGLASEWIVAAPLLHGNDAEPRLRVFFNIRAYRDANSGIANVRVDTVIENDLTYAVSPKNVIYSATLTAGNHRYTVDNLTHYRQARWHHVLWTQGSPKLYVKPSVSYWQSTGAISKYANLAPSNTFLNSVIQHAAPMSRGNQSKDMGAAGAQAAIGPLPRWTSTYVVSGDRRAYRWMLADDDAAGSYSFHYRDDQTGRPVTIVDHPYITIADLNWARRAGGKLARDLLPACQSACHNPNRFNIAHHPSIAYVSYLVTGDFYYLEEMQFTAGYVELWANPTYRRHAQGRLLRAQQQVRGQAWSLRSISDAAFATPDDDPMKPYFVNQINTIIHDYLHSYVDAPGHALHTLDSFGAIHYPAGPTNTSIAPWQEDFFTWAAGHAAEQQVPGAKRLLDWLASFQIGLMTSAQNGDSDGFCWIVASGYTFKLRSGNNAPVFKTLSAVYKATYPSLAGLPCASQAMANQLTRHDDHLQRGQMKGYSPSSTGFPSNLQIALAAAADSDAENGRQAWRVFQSRSVKPDYSSYPNFAVVPRSGQ